MEQQEKSLRVLKKKKEKEKSLLRTSRNKCLEETKQAYN